MAVEICVQSDGLNEHYWENYCFLLDGKTVLRRVTPQHFVRFT